MDVLSSTNLQRLFFNIDVPFSSTQDKHPRNLRCDVKMSMRHGELSQAHLVLDQISLSDTFAWNNLIQTHLTNGDAHSVISIHRQMLLRGVRHDKHTLPRILAASRLSGDLFYGKQVHGQAVKLGFSSDRYVVTALIQMYGRLDGADTAKLLLDKCPCQNSISWTLLLRLYITENRPDLAIHVFHEMVKVAVEIDAVALATVISACGMLKSLMQGRKVHEIAKKCGLDYDVLVTNTLLKMYIDCGSLEEGRAVFDGMASKDVISWTAIINGCVKKGGFNEGLKLFRQMNIDAIRPDSLSISSILPACARITALKHGKEIHGYLLRSGIDLNIVVQNAIMDMYVKSGSVEFATKIFAGMKNKDVISWTVMIMGYSLHGRGDLGVDLFRQMKNDPSIEIDEFTYTAVLHACSTARMVEEGRSVFSCIRAPKATHCTLMVTLLARAGLFDDAQIFIEEWHMERHAEVLRTLLDGCRIHRQAKLGKRVIDQLCELEPLNADNYVLLSNWYACNGKQDMVDKLRGTIIDMGLKPKKAYSWTEFRNKVHVFGTGDVSHPRSEKIYWELQCLMKKMGGDGHGPKADFSLHDVVEERECIHIGHSEMLALSYGLISTQAGTTIRITKNLRVCHSCHDSAKAISKIVDREIIIKDPKCFHHFKKGSCSCEDLC